MADVDEVQSGGILVSLKLEDLRWKVSATERTISGRNWRHAIQDFRGLPMLSISYETENQAKKAELAIREAVNQAIDISKSAIR
jgi:hypothetical protein